jgi:hypothetical protein
VEAKKFGVTLDCIDLMQNYLRLACAGVYVEID